MNAHSKRGFGGRRSALAAAVAGAMAFQAMPQIALAQQGEQQDEMMEEVVVTGTLIRNVANLVETSPVIAISDQEFRDRGVLRVEDMINTLPQAFGAQGSNLANGATGTATVDLRGLGAARTLVLLNGRRLPYGSLVAPAAPDINFIPAFLIERTDILTGGASATYGSDAIAGVVNFVMKDDFEGFRIYANYSTFQHNNDNSLQSLLTEFNAANPNQYEVVDGNVTDGETYDFTVAFGSGFADDRGHFTAFLGYQDAEEVLQGDRDYSQCALGTRNGGNEFTCSGSPTNEIANILNLGTVDLPNGDVWARVNNGQLIDRSFTDDTFNFNPFNHYQRPNERINAGMFATYDISETVEFYSELMYMNNETNSQIAPSGVFGLGVAGDAGGINCDNVFFSAQQFDFLCGSRGLTTDDVAEDILILRRNVEGGQRNNDIQHTTIRALAGLRGDLADTGFVWDVYASYAKVDRSEVYNNDLSKRRIALALDAVADPATGEPVCAVNADTDPSNDDPLCVPYDIWTGNAPDEAAVAYLAAPLNRSGDSELAVVSGTLSGSLEQYGIISPMASEAVAAAAGFEWRRQTLDSNPDLGFQSGDGAGQGGPTNPISGSQKVLDLFFEVNVPLIQGRELIDHFGFDLAYRRSDYDTFETDSYKFGIDYAPLEDVRVRASYQRAVRAPNIFELFAVQGLGLFDLPQGANGNYDPCSGTNPTATLEQCARTGVTAAQYGSIADNPAGQFNNLEGGNPDLAPEESDTYTFGVVFTPRFLPGFTASLDYFDISLEGRIDNVDENQALTSCLQTGEQFFCSLINRGNGGTLWAGQTGFVVATDINTGSLSTKGFDLLANYDFEVGDYGNVNIDYVGTFLQELEEVPLPTSTAADTFDCAGYYGGACGAPNPEYRHKVRATWSTPWDLSITGTWRFFGEVDVAQSSTQPALAGSFSAINQTLDSQNYFDLSASYMIGEIATLRAGVNNVLDEDPPLSSIVGTAPGNGNTYPQVYDAFGRYLFLGATIDF